MSVFQVTSPDGRVFEVTAPDGATQADVLRQAQQQQAQPPAGLSSTVAKVPQNLGTETYFDIPSMSLKERPKSGDVFDAMGQGAERFIRGAGNLVVSGLNKVAPQRPQSGGFGLREPARHSRRMVQQ